MLDEFGPQRVVDTPISELGFAGLGVGAAMAGLRPIIEFMTFNFAFLALDQVINNAAKLHYMSDGQFDCPIVFRGPTGAALQLSAQHSQACETYYTHAPGCKVVTPGTPADAKGLLKAAIRDDDPVAFMEGELLYNLKGEVPDDDDFVIPLGVADLKREGSDVSIITHGKMIHVALQAAGKLEKEGIEADVLDLRTIRPLDMDAILETVAKTNRVVYVEEGWPYAGTGAQVVSMIQDEAFDHLDAPVKRVTQADVPMPYAKGLENLGATRCCIDERKNLYPNSPDAGLRRSRRAVTMATKVHMEALSPTMEEGQLVQWLKSEGDDVSNGDVLAEIETDKATMELVARGEGILRKIFLEAGGTAEVGAVIAVIAADEEDISSIEGASGGGAAAVAAAEPAVASESAAPAQPAPAAPTAPAALVASPTPTPAGDGGRVKASPLARRLAEEMGLDLKLVQGSGPGGRIVKRDVEAAKASGVSAPAVAEWSADEAEYEDVPTSQMRKTIAKRRMGSRCPSTTSC
jgi:pyruvate dehydrogenase E1 component beta subunit